MAHSAQRGGVDLERLARCVWQLVIGTSPTLTKKERNNALSVCVICWGHGALCCSHANEAISIEWKGSWTHEPVPACVRFALFRNLFPTALGHAETQLSKVCVCVCVCMCLCVFEFLVFVCLCACVCYVELHG